MIKHSPNDSASFPVQVHITRGSMVESRHLVNAAVSDVSGKIVKSWGDVQAPVYLRSAIKPLQAIPLFESGAADAFDLTDREISLACASHTGENLHVQTVLAWLKRIGLSVDDLECGSHWPSFPEAERALAISGAEPTAAHNNCSGKHTGFLTTSLHLGENYKGYIGLDHPVQKRIVKVLEDFTELDLSNAPIGIDGCSIPTIGIPLDSAAFAIAKFADPSLLNDERKEACRRIQSAIKNEPDMIAGSDRMCTPLNRAAKGRVIAKVGAEGVYLAAIPELGLGVSLKAIDGTTRAAEIALGGILEDLGVMDDELRNAIAEFTHPVLKNRNNMEVGGATVDLG
ncbi:MAG: asparaginase [Sneathiella sp.]